MSFEKPQNFGNEYHDYPVDRLTNLRDRANLPISPEDLEKLCLGNETLELLYNQMISYCVRYAEDVLRMERLYTAPLQDEIWRSEMEELDRSRHDLHEATVDSINILSRNLKKFGKSNEWLRPLIAGGRSVYGKFAIGIAFSYYLLLRRKEA